MSKEFKASNGLTVRPHIADKGVIVIEHSTWMPTDITAEEVVALREFFEWEVDHKPWHEAKRGEVWALVFDGAEEEILCAFNIAPHWFKVWDGLAVKPENITAGRRIWPENAS